MRERKGGCLRGQGGNAPVKVTSGSNLNDAKEAVSDRNIQSRKRDGCVLK